MTETVIVEVNGVKLEVDMRTAKRVETLRVGDQVKVLKKGYSSSSVYSGVVVGFEPFKELPSIVVAYIEKSFAEAKIHTITLNKESKDVEILKSVDDILVDHNEAVELFNNQIARHEASIRELKEKREYFLRNFASYWAPVEKPVAGTII